MDSIDSDGVEREQVGQPRHGWDGHASSFDREKSNFKRALVWQEMVSSKMVSKCRGIAYGIPRNASILAKQGKKNPIEIRFWNIIFQI